MEYMCIYNSPLFRHADPPVRHQKCICPGAPPAGGSRGNMLLLLHMLIPLLPPSESLKKQSGAGDGDVTDVVPWLRYVWRARSEAWADDADNISAHLEKMAFLRYAVLLGVFFVYLSGLYIIKKLSKMPLPLCFATTYASPYYYIMLVRTSIIYASPY